jgi:hypothetical protein
LIKVAFREIKFWTVLLEERIILIHEKNVSDPLLKHDSGAQKIQRDAWYKNGIYFQNMLFDELRWGGSLAKNVCLCRKELSFITRYHMSHPMDNFIF